MKKELYFKDLQKWQYAKNILAKNNINIADPDQPHWSGNGNGTALILTIEKTKEPIFIYRKECFEDIESKLKS